MLAKVVDELEEMPLLQARQQGSVGNGTRACPNGPSQINSVFQVFDAVNKPSVIRR